MRTKFAEYYHPSEDEFHTYWEQCAFVFDANVLLSIYRYSDNARESLFNVINRFSNRIWLPHQAAHEFFENRYSVIFKHLKTYDELEEQINTIIGKIHDIRQRNRHPLSDQLFDNVVPLLRQSIEQIELVSESHPNLLENDELLERITTLFDGRTGDPFDEDKLRAIYVEGEKRYKSNIPPGYADETKESKQKKYGDLIIWKQILDYANQQKCPIIFVTGDIKDDWWQRIHGKTLGPRPELIREMRKETEEFFYMYSIDQFLTYAQQFLDIESEDEVVQEIKRVQQISIFSEQITLNPLLSLTKEQVLQVINLVSYWRKNQPDYEERTFHNFIERLEDHNRKKVINYLMSLDEQAIFEMVALMWLGRNDYENISSWNSMVEHALNTFHSKEEVISYMIDKLPLPQYLRRGLQKINEQLS